MKNFELERFGACALNIRLGYQPALAQQIISKLDGSCAEVFLMTPSQRLEFLGPGSKVASLLDEKALDQAASVLTSIEKKGYFFVPFFDTCFPENLKQCEDCPTGLYVRSANKVQDIFSDGPFISVVGTRDISPYGLEWCTKIVSALSQSPCRPKIVSGLALGVDIRAHMDALAFSLGTIGVLPTGIDEVYPRSHTVAAGKIAAAPGSAIISDYPPGTAPQACTFLRRNRIIAGLGASTILIESKRRGGGMITARLAFGYSRSVFVLPGRIDDIRSEGCNLLLQEGIASPISDLGTLAEALGLGSFDRHRSSDFRGELESHFRALGRTEDLERLVMTAVLIKKNRGISIEDIALSQGITYPEALSLTAQLESEGFIETDLMQRCSVNYRKIM